MLAITLSLFLAAPFAGGRADRNLCIDGQWGTLAKVPESVPAAARALIERERSFVEKNELKLYTSTKTPVVVISEWNESAARSRVEDVRLAIEAFREIFPPAAAPPPVADDEIDNVDPEAPFPIYLLDPGPTYEALVDRLIAEHEYLEGWGTRAKTLGGFHLYRPRIVAILPSYFDPKHQVIHDVTHVLAHQRYGRQPFWLDEGIAWYSEDAMLRGIFAFCYRHNFLWDAEKTGWSRDFSNIFRGRGDRPTIEDLTRMMPGSYTAGESGVKDPRAVLAYGLVAFLVNERRDGFAKVLDAFANDAAETGEFEPTYETPSSRQIEILRAHLGEDLDKALASFAAKIGNSIPKPKKSAARANPASASGS